MKKIILLIVFLFTIPFVFGAFNIPSDFLISKDASSISKKITQTPLEPKSTIIPKPNTINPSLKKPLQSIINTKTKLSKNQLLKTRQSLPTKPTSVDCYEFEPKKIDFPKKTYENLKDCELLEQRKIADNYIQKIRETARKCFEQARDDLSLFDQKLKKLIQEVNNVNEIEGRGITETTSSLMQESLDIDYNYNKLNDINKNGSYKIREALDALTRQVEGICQLSGNINNNVFRLCQDINQRITTGTDKHEPGLTKAEKEGFVKALQGQKRLADKNFNSARSNYKIVDKKETLEDIIFVKGVENTCKKGYSSDLLDNFTESEKKKKGLVSPVREGIIKESLVKNKGRTMSREELKQEVRETRAQQQLVRDRRQQTLSYFQTLDQRSNQQYNMLSSILRIMQTSQNATRRGII
ncbi:hypothetical protein HYV79_01255 [Candidatus Woesearchaeota archaeon]|nr:hypothetical protein [Candidatus Woesearchaeota archaeon]